MTNLLVASGKILDVENLDKDDITLADIAAGLANSIRYRGGLGVPLTVAQHCIMLSHWSGFTTDERRLALLHDAAEAYLGDIPSPVKLLDAFAPYRQLENGILGIIYDKYDISEEHWETERVSRADQAIREVECAMFTVNRKWLDKLGFFKAAADIKHGFDCGSANMRTVLNTYMARNAFLERAEELGIHD